MDFKRIRQPGAAGAAKNQAQTASNVGAIQTRALGGVNVPRFNVLRLNDFAVSSSASWTNLTFDFAGDDTYGIVNSNLAQINIDATAAGLWLISMASSWKNNNTGTRYMKLSLNGSLDIEPSLTSIVASSANGSNEAHLRNSFLLDLQEGDTYYFKVFQSSGGSLAANYAHFQGIKIA